MLIFQYVLNPTFAKDEILQLDKSAKVSRAFDGTMYLPGWYMKTNLLFVKRSCTKFCDLWNEKSEG